MVVQTMTNRAIELKQDALETLRSRVKGPIFAAGDASYEESRTV